MRTWCRSNFETSRSWGRSGYNHVRPGIIPVTFCRFASILTNCDAFITCIHVRIYAQGLVRLLEETYDDQDGVCDSKSSYTTPEILRPPEPYVSHPSCEDSRDTVGMDRIVLEMTIGITIGSGKLECILRRGKIPLSALSGACRLPVSVNLLTELVKRRKTTCRVVLAATDLKQRSASSPLADCTQLMETSAVCALKFRREQILGLKGVGS